MTDAAERPPGRLLGSLIITVTLLGVMISAGTWFGALWWPLELLAHFHGCYAVGLAVAVVLCALTRQWRGAVLALVVGLVDAAFVAPLYVADAGVGPAVNPAPDVLVLSANLNAGNRDLGRFVAFVAEVDPDILAVQELSTHASRRLSALRAAYPFHLERAQDDTYGIALYSKWPCENLRSVDFIERGTTSISARVRTPAGALLVINTHPIRPGIRGPARSRDAQLGATARYLADLGDDRPPTLVVGDFNTSSWTRGFRDLCEVATLRDSRVGFGLQATWPSEFVPFGTAIDHALISDDVNVSERAVGPDIGSDHRPIVIGLRFERR